MAGCKNVIKPLTMSRGRRHMIQLDEPASRTFYSNEPTYNQEMEQNDEEDSYNETRPTFSMNKPAGELDNKVANFLAEIDAMDEPMPEPPPPAPGTPEFVQTKKGDSEKHGKQMKLEPWPEEPTTDWQQLKDEKTNYPYYWNMHTNAVVWDMPPEFSQYLLRHKDDEASKESKQASAVKAESAPQKTEKTEHKSKHRKNGSSSEDSSSDSSDSEGETSRKHKPRSPRQDEKSPKRETEKGGAPEVSSSSSSASSRDSHKHAKSSVSPDSTRPDDKKPVQELMKKEENKEKVKEEKPSKGEDDRHRKHSRHDRDRDSRHERDRRRDRVIKDTARIGTVGTVGINQGDTSVIDMRRIGMGTGIGTGMITTIGTTGEATLQTGDSDEERSRSADAQDNEVKKLEVLQLAELALSKLEFLEVSKKGLSKLQILLIELETRHQDWQAGGLTTIHFLAKLREANWQLEQYEGSAAPLGWKCSWDRDYRRYYYTHKRTGKTQWDYPDADEMKNEDDKAEKLKKEMTSSSSKTEPSSSSQYSFQSPAPPHKLLSAVTAPPPPPPPPAEEHSAVKSLQLMYGSDSEEEETEEQQQPPKEPPAPILPDELPPLPPDNHHHKEKKEKKKKKKKDKSKKKEKTESGQEFMSVGSMYPITMPALPPSQPPPPGVEPPTPEPTNVVDSSSAIAQVPVYGGSDADHYAMNDLPLKFGSVIESGPQLASDTVSYQQPPPPTDGEPAIGHYTSEAGGIGEPDQGVPDGAPFGHEAPQGVAPATEEKKKKKKEKKWQKVKKEVELEEQTRQMREAEIRRKLAELE
ncbi:FNBP4-like protein [Mya arenaria]|uniref:FNBP4-like protein n=1 Tax=Mya arenaria TaxID=6604 RepID=A0ABY7EXG3_MYAAR|nr:FNBP4-like protein [Mya arenaria]